MRFCFWNDAESQKLGLERTLGVSPALWGELHHSREKFLQILLKVCNDRASAASPGKTSQRVIVLTARRLKISFSAIAALIPILTLCGCSSEYSIIWIVRENTDSY